MQGFNGSPSTCTQRVIKAVQRGGWALQAVYLRWMSLIHRCSELLCCSPRFPDWCNCFLLLRAPWDKSEQVRCGFTKPFLKSYLTSYLKEELIGNGVAASKGTYTFGEFPTLHTYIYIHTYWIFYAAVCI